MTSSVCVPKLLTQNSSRCANSIAMRPRLSHTPPRMVSISASDFSGNASRRFSRPSRCSLNSGPILRISAPAKFAMRRRSVCLMAPSRPTVRAPATLSSKGLKLCRIKNASKQDDDLAKNLPAFEPRQAALEFGERHFGVDHRIHPRRHLGEALADIADRAAERAEDAVLLQIELEQVELDRLAGGRAAGPEPPAALEAEQRAVERVRADMLEGDVDTLFAGELAHRGFEAIGAIIDDVIGAERLGLFTFGIVADGGEHGGADGFGHFDRAGADAGAAGLDQDRFAGLQLGIVEQHVLHGAEGDRRAGGVAETHVVGHLHHEPRRHVDEIAREAVDMETHDARDIFAEIVAAFLA